MPSISKDCGGKQQVFTPIDFLLEAFCVVGYFTLAFSPFMIELLSCDLFGKRVMKKNPKIEFEESSGNVFADLGLEHPEALLVRSQLGHSVKILLEKQNLKQNEIGKLLGIKQPEVSDLMKGRYALFPQERLFGFLNKFGPQSHDQSHSPA